MREMVADGGAVLDAVRGLQNETAGLASRVSALARDITTGRTRDLDRIAQLERRLEAVEG